MQCNTNHNLTGKVSGALHLHCLLRFSVADFAEDKLKIFGSRFNWNCKPIVLRIYSLFHGSPQPQSRQPQQGRSLSTAPGTKLELQRSPVHIRLKLKLVPYLLKSDAAADVFPQSVQVRTYVHTYTCMDAIHIHVYIASCKLCTCSTCIFHKSFLSWILS